MTTPKQILVERCTIEFDFGEHEFEPDAEAMLSDKPTPEVNNAYTEYLLASDWVTGNVIEVLFENTPTGLEEAELAQREYAEYHFRKSNLKNLKDLKTYILEQSAEWGYQLDTFLIDSLLFKVSKILTKGGWLIVAASFNEFEGHHNNTSIEVGLERRSFEEM